MKYILLTLALIATCFSASFAQSGLSIDVTQEQSPLSFANIIITGRDTTVKAVTDVNGHFEIRLKPGTYQVTVAYTGSKTWGPNKVAVKKNRMKKLSAAISSGVALNEVVVTKAAGMASKPIPTSTSVGTYAPKMAVKGKQYNYYMSTNMAASGTIGRARSQGDYAGPASRGGIRRDTIGPDNRNAEQYDAIVENPFIHPDKTPVSTFSIDVDVASYSNVRRFLNAGQKPPIDAVRIEEMVNYFDYQYPDPKEEHPIEVVTELGVCPWQPDHHLLMVGLQGRKIDAGQLPPSNLVFLIDVSGSMNAPDRLPLVQQSLHLLTEQLRPQDRVAIVVYAGAAGLALESTSGSEKAKILAAVDVLRSGGSTAGSAGIKLAYEIATKNFMPRGNNRVILCTDGDFNVGTSSEDELVKLIEEQRATGVYLTILGYGRGNYQDGKMQALADKGNGNHAYIDQISEARKVLVKEFGSTLFTIAKDVKLQLDFNPAQVSEYRLIGYENRLLNKEDFDNDKKDAGELGAGHHVTAFYEIVPTKSSGVKDAAPGELVKLKFRYKPPTGEQPSRLIEKSIPAVCTARPSDNYNLASSVAEFGLLLRDSKYKGGASWNQVVEQVKKSGADDPGGYKKELLGLVEKRSKM
jgi:Ca-activated chloride channel family protein